MSNQDHHNDDHLSLGDPVEDPLEIAAALQSEAWKRLQGELESYWLESAGAMLVLLEHGAEWSRYQLLSATLPTPRADAVLIHNGSLRLPAKYVCGPEHLVRCVVDIPLDALTHSDAHPNHGAPNANGLVAWSQGLTGELTQQRIRLTHTASYQVAQAMGQWGWSATTEGDTLEVHLELPDVDRRLRIEPSDYGYRVSAHLMPLVDLSSLSARVVKRLALWANLRLPLVRFSEDVLSDPPQLLAEVQINVALVPDVWLMQALAAVEAAVATTARELLAHRDHELAQIFLAAC